jgi:photosystem II stability/assembly factor-like uncharacterized protein
MHSKFRPMISFGIGCVGCLATALLALPAAAGANSWTAIGPNGANNSYGAPFAVDPSSPSTIYSVVNGTTIMRTTDGGGHWADLTGSPAQFEFLGIDPSSPDTIYAVGRQATMYGASVYKSIDGGVSWASVSNGLGTSGAWLLAIAPSLSSTLYAVGDQGVLKSIDGGSSWAKINNGLAALGASALAIDPTNAGTAYLAMSDTIFKLAAGTDQWRQVPIALPTGANIDSLTIDPAAPSIIYATYSVTADNDTLVTAGVFKSIDSGETWFGAQNPPTDTNGVRLVTALAIDRSSPTRIYAATNYGVYMSNDGAASWTPINSGLTSLFVWGISIDRTGSILRTASYTGLFEYQVSASSNATSVDLDQHGLTGFWYDPQTSGQGFGAEVFPDLLSPGTGLAFVTWFTYDSLVGDAEHQRWYTLSGPVVSGQPNASLTIYQNTGGNFNAPPITASVPVGTATLSFDSCITGRFSYTFTDGSGRSGTIPLQRLMQNVSCSPTGVAGENIDFIFSASWYDPATAGQGITVEVNPVSNALFFAWETYAPNGANAGPAGQRWYTGQGAFVADSRSIAVQLYESTGGLFNTVPPIPSTVAVGSATLEFQDCSDATLSYSFTGGSNSGASGTIQLGRGPVPYGGAGCWDYY